MIPITCHHEQLADLRLQDGGLPHVVGACCYQVARAAKNPALSAEGRGFTYNHAAMLAYWNDYFLYEYLAGPKGEHETPSAVFLCKSKDSIHWEKPVEVFPPADVKREAYRGPGQELLTEERIPLVLHHRMGFYTTSRNRLLISSFCGICPNAHISPNNGYGVGRVVREIYADFTMSDIYFIRYNEAGGYEESQVDIFSYYKNSPDKGFIEACEELLADRLATQQWWEEERLDTDFFTRPNGKALSYYTLPDKRIMGVFKDSLTSMSADGGETWSELVKSPSIITATGKVWGERMPDGTYALVYNPSPDGAHRWPLAITTGENGRDFYDLSAIVPEISPCRYEGALKNLGAQYMRGIAECNRRPADMAAYIAYSVNKEDMWIARIPNPVKNSWTGKVQDCLSDMTEETLRNTWNLYVPSWGSARLEAGSNGRGLRLTDYDPYDRVRAERIFEGATDVKIKLHLQITALREDKAAVLIQSRDGQTALAIVFRPDGKAAVRIGGKDQEIGCYSNTDSIKIEAALHCGEASYSLSMQTGETVMTKKGALAAAVKQVERAVITTKYTLPFQTLEHNGRNGDIGNLPGADTPAAVTDICVYEVAVSVGES